MKTRILTVTTAIAVVALMPTAALRAQSGPGPTHGEPQESSGTCLETVVRVEVDGDAVRKYFEEQVPDERFQPAVNAAGKASVNLTSVDCSIFLDSQDGTTPIQLDIINVDVPIEPPPNGDDECANRIVTSYDVLRATDSREYYRWLQRLGSGTLIEDSTFESAEGPPATVFVDVPGWFTFTMVGTDPSTVDAGNPPLDSEFWRLGRFGALRHCFHSENIRLLPGVAVVRAYPDSPLADMFGTEPIIAPGLIGGFDFTAESEVVD